MKRITLLLMCWLCTLTAISQDTIVKTVPDTGQLTLMKVYTDVKAAGVFCTMDPMCLFFSVVFLALGIVFLSGHG